MTSVGIMASAASVAIFPVVATVGTETGTSLGSNNAIPAPAGVAVGDLLVGFASYDATGSNPTAAAGWTTLAAEAISGSPHTLTGWARIAAGTGADTLTLTGVGGGDYAAAVLRVTGHHVTTPASDIKIAVNESSAAGAANPPNLDAGVSASWLWLAVAAFDITAAGQTFTPPTGYTEVANLTSATATATGLCVGRRDLTAQTENPGDFGQTVGRPNLTFTIAIP